MRYVALTFLICGYVVAALQHKHDLVVVSPTPLTAIDTTGEWVQQELALFNPTADSIEISRIRGGCACANATVLQRYIAPQDTGWVLLSVSTAHFKTDTNRVSFTLSSPNPRVNGMYVPLTIIRDTNTAR